jgi:hypothetical protein
MLAVPKTSTCVGVPSGVTTVAVTVALIVATPGLTAVTKPLVLVLLTLATPGADDAHVVSGLNVRSDSLPSEKWPIACSEMSGPPTVNDH